MLVAALPWYDFAETRRHHDRLWQGVAGALRAAGLTRAPARLSRAMQHDRILLHRDLLLTQTCGYVVAREPDLVRLVATPVYDAPGCEGAGYSSHVVVPRRLHAESVADLRGLRCIANEPYSHSGANVLRALAGPLHGGTGFFRSVRWSGGHLESLALVAAGAGDVTAVDCVTWELVRRYRPAALRPLRILTTPPSFPAPPLVTGRVRSDSELGLLRATLQEWCASPATAEVRAALCLAGVSLRPLADYAPMLAIEPALAETGAQRRRA